MCHSLYGMGSFSRQWNIFWNYAWLNKHLNWSFLRESGMQAKIFLRNPIIVMKPHTLSKVSGTKPKTSRLKTPLLKSVSHGSFSGAKIFLSFTLVEYK